MAGETKGVVAPFPATVDGNAQECPLVAGFVRLITVAGSGLKGVCDAQCALYKAGQFPRVNLVRDYILYVLTMVVSLGVVIDSVQCLVEVGGWMFRTALPDFPDNIAQPILVTIKTIWIGNPAVRLQDDANLSNHVNAIPCSR